jgi:hypothetical protein
VEEWQEFPWEQIIIKTDIIKKWSKVDVKYVNLLHANYDLETQTFINLQVEQPEE